MRAELNGLESVSNDAESMILGCAPYTATVTVEGTAPILFHRWSCEAIEEKAKAKKGSEAKRTDDIESYVYRNHEGELCLPGTYLVGSIIDPRNGAAKYIQDPRSPRKSALDLYRAGVVALTDLASLGVKKWDYVDQRRVTVQRAGITRRRPAMDKGWRVTVDLSVLLPEYIGPQDLLGVLTAAGRLVGVGDFRPTYGRFQVVSFETTRII